MQHALLPVASRAAACARFGSRILSPAGRGQEVCAAAASRARVQPEV